MPLSLDDILNERSQSDRLALDDVLGEAASSAPEYGWLDRIVTGGLRVVPSIGGTLLGTTLGAAAGGIGAVPGAVAGGGAGAGVGEFLAQLYERSRGLRADLSPGSVAVEAALGAVPLGKSASLTRAALKGAGLSAAGTLGHAVAEEGELPDAGTLALSGGIGALFGAGGEQLARRMSRTAGAAPDVDAEAFQPQPSVEFSPTPSPRFHGPMRAGGFARYVAAENALNRQLAEEDLLSGVVDEIESARPRAGIVAADERVVPLSLALPATPSGVRPVAQMPGGRITREPSQPLGDFLRGMPLRPPVWQPSEEVRRELDDAIEQLRAADARSPASLVRADARRAAESMWADDVEEDVVGGLGSFRHLSGYETPPLDDLFELAPELRVGGAARRAADEMWAADMADDPVAGVGNYRAIAGFDSPPLDELGTELRSGRSPGGGGSPPPSPLAALLGVGRDAVAHEPGQPGADRLPTGELQPRLPIAGAVRELDLPTPVEDVPFALTPQIAEAGGRQEALLFDAPRWERREAEAAVRAGYPGTVDEAEAEIVRRARELYDAMHETGGGPQDFLRAVAAHGGLDLDDPYLPGEMRWLGEMRDRQGREAFGVVAGVPNVLRRGKGQRADALAALLRRDPRFADMDRDRIVTGIGDATRRRQNQSPFDVAHYSEGAGIQPGSRWWEAPDEPDFLRELTPEIVDEPGMSGRISNELAGALGGATLGGVAGGTQGDTLEERAANAAGGAALGAAGTAGLARLLRRRAPAGGAVPSSRQAAPPPPARPDESARSVATPTGRLTSSRHADVPVVAFESPTNVAAPRRMPREQREDLGLDNFPDEQREIIGDLVKRYGPDSIEAQRRGRQPVERSLALGREMALRADKKLAPGTNLSPEGHAAYGQAVASVQDQLRELAARIKATGGSDSDLLEQLKLKTAHEALFLSYEGLRSEAGRTLNLYKHLRSVMPSNHRLVRELLDRGQLRKDIGELSDILAALPDDPVLQFRMLRDQRTRTLNEKIGSYFTSNILSGLQTQERNLLGNAAKIATRIATKTTTGGIDALRSLITGAPREVYSREGLHEMQGAITGFDRAWADAAETFRLGFSPTQVREEAGDLSELIVRSAEFAGGGRNPFNLPGRLLQSVDRFFRTINGSMELYAHTYAQARRELGDASDTAIARRVSELRSNPSESLQRRVRDAAERGVYQEDAGPAVNALLTMKRHVPALQFVIPFVRTVANIMRQGAEHSPLGFVMKRAGSDDMRERTIAQGEAAFGTAALVPLAYLAATGRLSGAGPTDPAERARLRESGWQPNSINLPLPDGVARIVGASPSQDGTYWISYTLAQPLAIPASIVANGFDAYRQSMHRGEKRGLPAAASKIASETIARVGKSALDQSFLSGLADLVEAINDPERAAETFVGRLLQGFIPLSGLARNVARVVDPVVRRPESIQETIEAGIPGLSTRVAPRLDRWGEPIVRDGSSALVVPEIEPVVRDPISAELERIGIDIGMPTDRITLLPGQRLSPDQSLRLRAMRGQATRALLHAIMGAPGYERLPDHAKAEVVQRMLRDGMIDVNEVARFSLQAGRPDLLRYFSGPIAAAAQATY